MNACTLQGHISGEAEERTLPSGDVIAVFRLVVPRPDGQRVDTIDCSASSARLRRRILALPPGAVIQVEGALHRRFYRGAQGVASRYEVAITTLERVRTAA